ncbi:MAG: DsbA family protein, partial [Pseudomonadota bacterium]|nr:DsbA family protein [Pseudomonadota bacterium]
MKIEFFWDIGSTNTYFALHLIRPIVARYGAELVMHPFNLGYVFRHHQYVLAEEPQAKLQNRGRDLRRWAEKYRLGFRMPDTFPIKTSRALRGALVAREFDREGAYIDRLFTRYWEENDASISEYEGIASLAKEIEIDPDLFITR